MIIEIKGVQFVNKGAELMLAAILQRIEQYWPDAEIALAPNANSPYLKRARLGAWQKLSIRKHPLDFNNLSYRLPNKVSRFLKSWGMVTEADIDVVLDASGFAYGDQWNPVLLKQALAEAKRCHDNGQKYIFLPQAFGPFTKPEFRQMVEESMQYASLVCAREATSGEHLSAIMKNTINVKVFPDFTNALKSEIPSYMEGLTDRVCLIPNHNMIGDKNPNQHWKSSYLKLFVTVAKKSIELGLTPFILNHEGKEDQQICQQINSLLDKPLEIVTEEDPTLVKGIIKQSKAIVCSRFHGCVSALSQAIPCLGTSWSHKYEQLFSEYGVSEYLIEADWQEGDVSKLLENAVSQEPVLMKNLNDNSSKYKELTESMWAEVVKVVNRA